MRSRWASMIIAIPLVMTGCKMGGADASAAHLRGKVAPDFTLKDLDNQDIKLSDYRGKPIMLAFWAYG